MAKDLIQRMTRRMSRAGRKLGPGSETKSPPKAHGIRGLESTVRVETDFGLVPAMLLRPRDRLRTTDGGYVHVIKIDKVAFDTEYLSANTGATAITIAEGTWGGGLPRREIALAPQQLITGDPNGGAQDIVQAQDCIGLPGIGRARPEETVYHVLSCEGPAEILAEGLPVRV